MTYDSTLKEKYGQNINIDKDEDSLDMSEYVNTEEDIKENYSKGNESKEIEKNIHKKTENTQIFSFIPKINKF